MLLPLGVYFDLVKWMINTMANSFLSSQDMLERISKNKGVDAQMTLRDKLKAYASDTQCKILKCWALSRTVVIRTWCASQVGGKFPHCKWQSKLKLTKTSGNHRNLNRRRGMFHRQITRAQTRTIDNERHKSATNTMIWHQPYKWTKVGTIQQFCAGVQISLLTALNTAVIVLRVTFSTVCMIFFWVDAVGWRAEHLCSPHDVAASCHGWFPWLEQHL